jgi:hypothetical protein
MEKSNALELKVRLARLLCANLAAFDILLGGASLAAPSLVLKLFSPRQQPAGETLLRRAGAIWLFFVPLQLRAALNADNPKALRAVSVLRLQEVPADPIWLASGEGFGAFGRFGLVFAPVFNLVAGLFLAHVARELEARHERAAHLE